MTTMKGKRVLTSLYLDPPVHVASDRLALMVTEIQRHLIQLFKEHAARSSEAPQELKELEARLDRLRKRLKEGDPDMAADELQAAIERAEAKRRQLKHGLQEGSEVTKVVSAIPRAAALCDQRITLGAVR